MLAKKITNSVTDDDQEDDSIFLSQDIFLEDELGGTSMQVSMEEKRLPLQCVRDNSTEVCRI